MFIILYASQPSESARRYNWVFFAKHLRVQPLELGNRREFGCGGVCVYCNAQPNSSFGFNKVPSYYVLSRVFICMCMSLSVWIYCFMSAQALICVFSWFNVPVTRDSVCVRWNSIWRWADPGVVTCFSAMGRCCDGPLPAGTGGPVSSAFWCEFHLSGDSVKVPVTLGKHMWAP